MHFNDLAPPELGRFPQQSPQPCESYFWKYRKWKKRKGRKAPPWLRYRTPSYPGLRRHQILRRRLQSANQTTIFHCWLCRLTRRFGCVVLSLGTSFWCTSADQFSGSDCCCCCCCCWAPWWRIRTSSINWRASAPRQRVVTPNCGAGRWCECREWRRNCGRSRSALSVNDSVKEELVTRRHIELIVGHTSHHNEEQFLYFKHKQVQLC